MQEPKRGMLVRILKGEEPYFKAGTLARLVHSDPDQGWWASFEDCGNEPKSYKREPGAYMGNPDDYSTWFIGFFKEDFEPANLETTMSKPEPGVLVRILKGSGHHFKAGTFARLESQDCDGDWWAEFSGCGNAFEDYLVDSSGDTDWCIGKFGTDFELA